MVERRRPRLQSVEPATAALTPLVCSTPLISDGEIDVYRAKPLFARPLTPSCVFLDTPVFVWAYICHLLLTAWPYIWLGILVGALSLG